MEGECVPPCPVVFSLAIDGGKSVLDSSVRDEGTDIVLSDVAIAISRWIIFTAVGQTICIFGIGTNIINIICFIKQGFKEPVNVSLLGLAFSDMGCLLVTAVSNICCTPAFISADLPIDAIEVSYLIGGIPHTTFTRITGWFTALITLERCLCITAPLKVKNIVTSKRMAVIFIFIFIILIVSVTPVYVVNSLGMKYFPAKNKTLVGLLVTDDRENVERYTFAINNAFLPFTAFVIIFICTVILAITLRKKAKWRKKSTSAEQADTFSNRNQKVAKMVVIISSMFIACYIPFCIVFIAMCMFSEFSVYGKYRDLLFINGGISFILETVNSSVNIFIYYHMSSKYRQIFHTLFGIKDNKLAD